MTAIKLCWHLGGSQTDVASLLAEDVDWNTQTIAYRRRKTGTPVVLNLPSFEEYERRAIRERTIVEGQFDPIQKSTRFNLSSAAS